MIRPTTDKVKEAIFSMIADKLYDAVVIDLFSGTGNLGLEALSRGAKRCYFGDNSRESISLIKQNINYCKTEEKSVLYTGDYQKILKKINEKADVIFLDPPYEMGLMLDCIKSISELGLLTEDGIIVAEHGMREILPKTIGSFEKMKEKRYGSVMVTIYVEILANI